MLRQLQNRADDLSESLMVFELEMKRAWNLERRMEAFRGFAAVVDKIDLLRRDAEEFLSSARAKDAMLERLDKKVSSIMRGEPYRVAEWFTSAEVDWNIAQAAIDPIRQSTQC